MTDSHCLCRSMKVHLVDGTYELFRHFFGAPPHRNAAGEEVAAVRGVLGSVLQLLSDGATHVGVATDHVIESFRNELWPGYKTGEGIDPDLWSQAWPLEEALAALGVVVWPMVELEADDALASAAAVAEDDAGVEQVIICTPDKDLGQCVAGTRVVQLDRRKDLLIDESGVVAKFGVGPPSIPDYLALVGDSADGFPGLAGWGAKSAAAVLARWVHLEDIPADPADWEVTAVARPSWRRRCATTSNRRGCSRIWRRSEWTARSSATPMTSAGGARGPDFAAICAGLDASGDSQSGGEAGGQPGRCLAHRPADTGHGAREAEVADVEVPAVGEADRTGHPRVEGDEEIAGGVGEHRLAPRSIDTFSAREDRARRAVCAGPERAGAGGYADAVVGAVPVVPREEEVVVPAGRPRGRAPRRSPTPRVDPASAGGWGWSPPRRICRWG